MSKRHLQEQRGGRLRMTGVFVLLLALVLAGFGGTSVVAPATATVAYAASTSASQATQRATLTVIGPGADGNNEYFLPAVSVSITEGEKGDEFVKSVFDANGIKFNYSDSQYGMFLTGIVNSLTGQTIANEDFSTNKNAKSWILYVNGKPSGVGISSVTLKAGDTVTWYYASYNADYSAPELPSSSSVKTSYVAMYRLYNPNSGEHFYTSSVAELENVLAAGWNDEGIGWFAPTSGDPVYRLYNANGGEHHYTLSKAEHDSLVAAGWSDEGIGWYSSTASHNYPLYREYNPNQFSCNHNYTQSKAEHDHLVSLGWRDEGIAWYAVR